MQLVLAHPLHADRVQVVDGGGQADGLGDGGVPASNFQGSSFQVALCRSTEAIMSPPVRNGCICVEELAAAVQHADARGAERLVAGPGVEVGSDRARRRPASAEPPVRRR